MSSIFLWGIGAHVMYAQSPNRYLFTNKTSGFSQTDWLEIMSDIANDKSVLDGMKGVNPGAVSLDHMPYVYFVNKEHKIVIKFCGECTWIVDSCMSTSVGNVARVSISAQDPYDFHIDDLFLQDIWNPGDTATELIYVAADVYPPESSDRCVLVPLITNIPIIAFPVFPNKKTKR